MKGGGAGQSVGYKAIKRSGATSWHSARCFRSIETSISCDGLNWPIDPAEAKLSEILGGRCHGNRRPAPLGLVRRVSTSPLDEQLLLSIFIECSACKSAAFYSP